MEDNGRCRHRSATRSSNIKKLQVCFSNDAFKSIMSQVLYKMATCESIKNYLLQLLQTIYLNVPLNVNLFIRVMFLSPVIHPPDFIIIILKHANKLQAFAVTGILYNRIISLTCINLLLPLTVPCLFHWPTKVWHCAAAAWFQHSSQWANDLVSLIKIHHRSKHPKCTETNTVRMYFLLMGWEKGCFCDSTGPERGKGCISPVLLYLMHALHQRTRHSTRVD